MIESATHTSPNGCEQKIDDVDVVDSGNDVATSAVMISIDFSSVATKTAPTEIVDNDKQSNETQNPSEIRTNIENVHVNTTIPSTATVEEFASPSLSPFHHRVTNENDKLKEALANLNVQLLQMETVLTQRESMIELQQKEMSLLEIEKVSIKRDFDVAKKEKEAAVVRYAMIEKSIIDLNNFKDLANKKLKDAAKEIEQLNNRLKTVNRERDKTQKDHRDSIRECESLKCELQMYESKNKYNQVKIKQETSAKNAMETKLAEVTFQLNQLNEEQKHRIDSEKRSEQEQGAQVILFKHLADEKDKEINSLQRKLTQLTTEFNDVSEKYNLLVVDHEYEKIEKSRYQEKVNALEQNLQLRNERNNELEIELTECYAKCEGLTQTNNDINELIRQLKETEEDYHDQKEEMAQIRAKEDEHLGFMKELTEKCVTVENQLILTSSKASALQLENDKIKHEFEVQQDTIKNLNEQLTGVKQKRTDEAKIFGRLLTEQKSNYDQIRKELENAQGELITQNRKHTQNVKDLNRQIMELKYSRGSSPKSIQPSNGTQSETNPDSANHSPCNSTTNGDHTNSMPKEPTTKALIARIAQLQAVLAKQTEKIEFLENHCIALTNELRSKST